MSEYNRGGEEERPRQETGTAHTQAGVGRENGGVDVLERREGGGVDFSQYRLVLSRYTGGQIV